MGETETKATNQKQRESWEVGRFLKTLGYFGIVPFVGSIRWIQQLLGSNNQNPFKTKPSVILVAGATGGVGKRVVQRLQQRGIVIRAMVRDAQRARKILGKQVEMVEADITIPETLTAQVFQDVTAIICCTGTKVQPVEGDTPNREKYYQGVKFYMPEVVDVPEIVEYQGIKNLVEAAKPYLGNATEQVIFDFTQTSEQLKEIWGALDDVVMGGVSQSSIQITGNTAFFTGNVSTANSGGFASVRTRNFEPPLDLSGFTGIDLRVKGDGKRYKFILRSSEKWDSIAYCYSFDTVYNISTTVRVPFDQLVPVFRAKTVRDGEPFDPSQTYSIQLMLSKFEYDGELNPRFSPGAFRLELESIKAYGGESLPQFVMVSSAGVTRPGKPGLDLEEEPPAVRMNDQLGGILTWKLRGEDVVRSSGIPYTIVRPCALTEESGGQSLMVDQGDTIKGKVSREDIAELCIQALNQPEARNTTFEVKSVPEESEQAAHASGDWSALFAQVQVD
ncbi:MAG: CIA30 family protein [Microcoleaceae cyanobacterium]